jgi:CelD/BcsL family acetyltransferase involved in cellulose biosynthesis
MNSALSLTTRADSSVFQELAPWWDRCPGPASTPFLRTEWFELWCDAYLSSEAQLEIAIWDAGGGPVAALPLSRNGLRHSALANAHSDVFDLVTDPDHDIASEVRRWLAGRPVTRLYRLDGASPLIPPDPDLNWRVDRQMGAPFLDLEGGIEHLTSQMSSSLKGDVRRRERRLEEMGEVIYLDNADGELPNAVERCLELEASGWKGRAGSAMLSQPESAHFYRRLAEVARDKGWLRLSALLVSERLVAFQLNLDFAGRRFLLKPGYDEELSRQSPGKVLQWKVLEAAATSGLLSYEFGGEAEEWKMLWAQGIRPRLNVLCFGSRGRAKWLGRAIRQVSSPRSDVEPSNDE